MLCQIYPFCQTPSTGTLDREACRAYFQENRWRVEPPFLVPPSTILNQKRPLRALCGICPWRVLDRFYRRDLFPEWVPTRYKQSRENSLENKSRRTMPTINNDFVQYEYRVVSGKNLGAYIQPPDFCQNNAKRAQRRPSQVFRWTSLHIFHGKSHISVIDVHHSGWDGRRWKQNNYFVHLRKVSVCHKMKNWLKSSSCGNTILFSYYHPSVRMHHIC